MAEDADRDLFIQPGAIAMSRQDVLDGLGEGDDAGFVVLARPQIQPIIGVRLDLSTSGKTPLIVGIQPPKPVDEQEE